MKNLILGGPGQDAFLIGELLEKNNEDFIITSRRYDIPEYYNKFLKKTKEIDLTKAHDVDDLIKHGQPEYIYNFAGISNITDSFENPSNTITINTQIHTNILESIRKFYPKSKVYFASSIEHLKGDSPYGLSKTLCMTINEYYRTKHNLFISTGINCQHNSKYRGESFFWGKVCSYVSKLNKFLNLHNDNIIINTTTIQSGKNTFNKLRLGNLNVARDILSAEDVVKSAHTMLSKGSSNDYIVSSGHLYSNKLILELAFKEIGISNWEHYCYIDKSLFRPKDDEGTIYYSDKLTKETGWAPEITVENLLKESINYVK